MGTAEAATEVIPVTAAVPAKVRTALTATGKVREAAAGKAAATDKAREAAAGKAAVTAKAREAAAGKAAVTDRGRAVAMVTAGEPEAAMPSTIMSVSLTQWQMTLP